MDVTWQRELQSPVDKHTAMGTYLGTNEASWCHMGGPEELQYHAPLCLNAERIQREAVIDKK